MSARLLSAILVVVVIPAGRSPLARAAAPAARAPASPEARERFTWGLKLFQDGDNAGALAEFRRVYDVYPSAAVLLKIGLVYAAMGRSAEATDTLDRALEAAAGGELDAEDLAVARAERALQARRVARLRVTSSAPATIDVDGIEVGRTPLPQPLRVVSGARVIGAVAPGHLPSRREVTVAGGEEAELHFELTPSEAQAAHLWVRSALPSADVLVDGARVGRTPVPGSLTVAPGRRLVALRRPGYLPVERVIELGDGAVADVTLDPQLDPAGSPAGRIALDVSEPDAEVSIDGHPASAPPAGMPLPPGEHNLHVERAGFHSVDRAVLAPDGGLTVVKVTLQPTEATRAGHAARVGDRRRLGTAIGVGGAVVAIAAAALWLRDRGVIADQDAIIDAYVACQTQPGMSCTTLENAEPQAEERRNSAQSRQDVASVIVGIGAIGLAAGAYLLLTAGDAHKYERPEARLAVVPAFWLGPQGGGLALARRF